MRAGLIVGTAILALGLGVSSAAADMGRLQPGMLTMMQQGGREHGVQSGRILPCSTWDCPSNDRGSAWSRAEPDRPTARRATRAGRAAAYVRGM